MEIKFSDLKDGISIFIPKELLKFAAENNPDSPLVIKDIDDFQTEVLAQLKDCYYDPETGLTKFQELLDAVMMEVAENGEECVDFKEN